MIFFHLYNRCYISQFCTDDNSTSISTTRWNRGSKVARSCHEQNDQFNIVIIEHVMYEHEQQTGFYHFRTISKDEIKNSKGWQRMDYRVNWIFAKIDKMLLTSVTNLVIIAWHYSTGQKLQRLRTIIVFAYCWNASFASVIFFVLFFPFSFFFFCCFSLSATLPRRLRRQFVLFLSHQAPKARSPCKMFLFHSYTTRLPYSCGC